MTATCITMYNMNMVIVCVCSRPHCVYTGVCSVRAHVLGPVKVYVYICGMARYDRAGSVRFSI